MLGKIIDGIIYTPTTDEKEKIIVSNPTEEQIKFLLGYKELCDNIPEYDAQVQCLEEIAPTEDDITVYRNYAVINISGEV